MDKPWYFEDHGRAQGPISTEELIAKVQKGELTLVDLVFQEGAGEWQPIEKYKNITSQIKPASVNVGVTSREADWIILRVIEVDGKERYEQIGPYNVEQVLELIDAGRVKFNDFVWKTGFQNWVPLGKLDKFDKPLASSVVVDESLYIKPKYYKEAETKSTPVKAYQPVQKAPELKDEAPPEGASGPDLAQPKWAASLKESAKVEKELPKVEKESPKVEAKKTAKAPEKKPEEVQPKKSSKAEAPREVFDFGQSISRLLSPLKGPKKAETADFKPPEPRAELSKTQITKSADPIRYEAVDLGERTKIYSEPPPPVIRPSKAVAKEPTVVPPKEYTHTSTAIPPVVTTKVIKKEARVEKISEPVAPVAPPRDPEAVEKMQGRWGKVAVGAAAVVAVVAGLGIFAMLGKKGMGDITAADVAFEKHGDTPSLSQFESSGAGAEPDSQPTVETAPPPHEEPTPTTASNLPPPSMDIPPDALPAKKATESESKTAKAEKPKVESEPPMDFANMSVKQKSHFHQQERMFIFYTSQKGLSLANLLDAAVKKKNKTPASWKKFQSVWQGQVNALNSKIAKELPTTKVHVKLLKSLKTAGTNMDKRGKEISAQMVSGRAPTKDPSVSDIIAEFKKINAKAKSLDQ